MVLVSGSYNKTIYKHHFHVNRNSMYIIVISNTFRHESFYCLAKTCTLTVFHNTNGTNIIRN